MWDAGEAALAGRSEGLRQQQRRRRGARLPAMAAAGVSGECGRAGCRLTSSCCCHTESAATDSSATDCQQDLAARLAADPAAVAGASCGPSVPRLPSVPVWLVVTWAVLLLVCLSASGAVANSDVLNIEHAAYDRDRGGEARHRRSVDNMTGEFCLIPGSSRCEQAWSAV